MYFTGSTADAWDNLFITILSFHAILHYSWKYLINGTAHLPLKIFFYFQYLFPYSRGNQVIGRLFDGYRCWRDVHVCGTDVSGLYFRTWEYKGM